MRWRRRIVGNAECAEWWIEPFAGAKFHRDLAFVYFTHFCDADSSKRHFRHDKPDEYKLQLRQRLPGVIWEPVIFRNLYFRRPFCGAELLGNHYREHDRWKDWH